MQKRVTFKLSLRLSVIAFLFLVAGLAPAEFNVATSQYTQRSLRGVNYFENEWTFWVYPSSDLAPASESLAEDPR